MREKKSIALTILLLFALLIGDASISKAQFQDEFKQQEQEKEAANKAIENDCRRREPNFKYYALGIYEGSGRVPSHMVEDGIVYSGSGWELCSPMHREKGNNTFKYPRMGVVGYINKTVRKFDTYWTIEEGNLVEYTRSYYNEKEEITRYVYQQIIRCRSFDGWGPRSYCRTHR